MKRKNVTDADIIADFLSAMAGAGLNTADKIEADGELHRFTVDGDPKNTKNGWYVLFLDGVPAGEFGCWKRMAGSSVTWCAKSDTELTPDENKAVRAKIEQARRDREERERMKHDATATEAKKIWDAAHEADAHAYLTRKGVKSHGLRVGEWPTGAQALLVPMYDGKGRMTTLQAIFSNVNPVIGRDKDFLAGGKKRGCFFTIGAPPANGEGTIALVEGYATGASVHEATGLFTVVSFDAGNLKPVAHELRRRYPAATILIAADNDRWTLTPIENPGLHYARELLEAIPARTLLAVPEFQNLDDKPTDFNDLHQREGIDAVRAQIMAVIPQPEPAEEGEANTPLDGMVNPFGFPHVSDKGQPLNTVENLAFLMNEYGIKTKYNVVRRTVKVDIPTRNYTADNEANNVLAELTSICARNRMPQSMLSDYIKLLADRNAYNPVTDWITSVPWDGTSRLRALYDTVGTSGDPVLRDKLLFRWLLSAVAAVFMPHGFESHGALVFSGDQGQGKTKWFKRLVPEWLHDVLLVGAILDPNNKDTVTNAVSHWMVEIGELDATFRKADIARLKSFITNAVDKIRRPYDRIESEYSRRTVFFASVNEERYLVDDTGNRRWWTIAVTSIDYSHSIDMQQVWAECLHLWQGGEQHYLTKDEMQSLAAVNAEHEAIDPVKEQILQCFDWDAGGIGIDMTATDVLLAIGYDKPTKAQATHASKVLKELTGSDPKKKNNGRFFSLPKRTPRKGRFSHDDEDRPF